MGEELSKGAYLGLLSLCNKLGTVILSTSVKVVVIKDFL